MEIKDFESFIIEELTQIIKNIIATNPTLPIQVKKGERQGDAISKFLEQKFVEETQNHNYFQNSKTSPIGKTKNPYDCETFFNFKNHSELVWIDFKAVNIANEDSNPDSGTPDKIISLIEKGHFYLAYIFVFYEGNDNSLNFVQKDNQFTKIYFLKDISPSVRITPANQLQVNYAQPPAYRTREEFIIFLAQKKKESFERRLKKAQKELEQIQKGIIYKKITVDELLSENEKQEQKIKIL